MRGKASIRTVAAAVAMIAALGILQMPTAALATPSTSHTVTQVGSVTTGPFTVAGLSASELTQTGTVIVNSTTVTINCVSVIVNGPGLHLAGVSGVDASGIAWYILVRQPTPVTGTVLVSNTPITSGWCSAGDWPSSMPPNTGVFLITP